MSAGSRRVLTRLPRLGHAARVPRPAPADLPAVPTARPDRCRWLPPLWGLWRLHAAGLTAGSDGIGAGDSVTGPLLAGTPPPAPRAAAVGCPMVGGGRGSRRRADLCPAAAVSGREWAPSSPPRPGAGEASSGGGGGANSSPPSGGGPNSYLGGSWMRGRGPGSGIRGSGIDTSSVSRCVGAACSRRSAFSGGR